MKKQSLVTGAFVLAIAAFLTRLLVLANSVVQSRVLSSEGIGLKMMVMPLMGLMITLATIGLPVAISKLIAEADAQRNGAKVKKILLVSSTITVSLSIILVLLAVVFGRRVCECFLTDQRSYYSFIALIPMIPIAAVSGVLKGYFRGMQTMNPLAAAQIFEQVARIGFTYFLVQWLMPHGLEYAAAGAVFSSVLGEGFSLLFLIVVFKFSHRRKFNIPSAIWKKMIKGKDIFSELLGTALPSTGNGLVFSVSKAMQPIVITKSLTLAGLSSVMVTKDYGMLTGFVMPLLFFPGFINQSLGTSLVPAISEANAENNVSLIQRRIYQAICVALGVGVPCTAVLHLFAQELVMLMYKSPQAAPLLQFIAPFFVLHYLQSPLQSVLVGLGKAKTAMLNNLLSKGATLLLIYPLTNWFKLAIYGVMLAISIGVIVETLLHFSAVYKLTGFYGDFYEIIKITLAGLAMGFSGKIISNYLSERGLGLGFSTVVSILTAVLIYFIILLFLKVICGKDINKIPFLGRIVLRLFPIR